MKFNTLKSINRGVLVTHTGWQQKLATGKNEQHPAKW